MQFFFDSVGLELIDFKVEFGKLNKTYFEKGSALEDFPSYRIQKKLENSNKTSIKPTVEEPFILADEFSCDTCRLWDKKNRKKTR